MEFTTSRILKSFVTIFVISFALQGAALGGSLVGELISPMSVPHNNAAAAACDGKLYVWGGVSTGGGRTSVLEAYDPSTNTWTTRADSPAAAAGLGAFALGGRLYSVGGEGPGNAQFRNTVDRYDPASNSWTSMGNFPVNTWDPLSAVCAGKGYVFSGRHGYGPSYEHVYQYDETGDSWVQKADMLLSVRTTACVTLDGKIWVFGGLHSISEPDDFWTRKVQVYDPAADSWTYCDSDTPVMFSWSQAVVYDEKVWLFTARKMDVSGNWVPNTMAYIFDPETETWDSCEFSPPVKTDYMNPVVLIDDYAYFTQTFDQQSNYSTTAWRVQIPEPATLSLLAVGGLVLIRRRRSP